MLLHVVLQKAAKVDVEKLISEGTSVNVTTSASHTTSAARTMKLSALPVSKSALYWCGYRLARFGARPCVLK